MLSNISADPSAEGPADALCRTRYPAAAIVAELGEDPLPWESAASGSLAALFEHCYDEADGMVYDRCPDGGFVRVPSDVLLRVLACEVGDGSLFASALRRYLLNTRKFFAPYPFTSLALDDPRLDHDFRRNSWGGPSNFLSLLRAPHAFEHHGRCVELSWVLAPALAAVCRMTRFPQTFSPWTGEQGHTELYSPAMLFTIDAVERFCGILARPDGELWFTGLLPPGVTAVGYARTIEGVLFESTVPRSWSRGTRGSTAAVASVSGHTGCAARELAASDHALPANIKPRNRTMPNEPGVS